MLGTQPARSGSLMPPQHLVKSHGSVSRIRIDSFTTIALITRWKHTKEREQLRDETGEDGMSKNSLSDAAFLRGKNVMLDFDTTFADGWGMIFSSRPATDTPPSPTSPLQDITFELITAGCCSGGTNYCAGEAHRLCIEPSLFSFTLNPSSVANGAALDPFQTVSFKHSCALSKGRLMAPLICTRDCAAPEGARAPTGCLALKAAI